MKKLKDLDGMEDMSLKDLAILDLVLKSEQNDVFRNIKRLVTWLVTLKVVELVIDAVGRMG